MDEKEKKATTYSLLLSVEDIKTIDWVGDRYSWSSWLRERLYQANPILGEGLVLKFHEYEMWDFKDAIEEDTQGGHSMLPLLDERSELYGKIKNLLESVV